MDPNGIQILVQNGPTWRGGQKLSASSKSAPIKTDTNRLFRINFRGLERVIAKDRRVCRRSLFVDANDPPLPLCGWKTFRATKPGEKDHHRFVQELTVDMGTLKTNFCFHAFVNGSENPSVASFERARECSRVYCIVSGDVGLKSVITATLDAGFQVELYSWKGGCSQEYFRMAEGKYSESLKIFFLDNFINEIGMETSKFEEGELPPNRTYVLEPHPNVDEKEFKSACHELHSQFSTHLPIQLLPSEKKRHVYMIFDELEEDQHEYEANFFKEVKEKFFPFGSVTSYVTFNSHLKAHMKGDSMSNLNARNIYGVLNRENKGEKSVEVKEEERCWMREFCDKGPNCRGIHTKQEKELFQANGGESPYKVNRLRVYLCPLMQAQRTCRLYTCEFSHKEHYSFCCQCATTHSRNWEANGGCENHREGPVTKEEADNLRTEGCILGGFEGPFLHAHEFRKEHDIDRLSTICLHREFCSFPDCTFFHTKEEKALFEENGGVSPYRLSKRGLKKLCQWCAEPHQIGPEHCPLRGKVRKLPITPQRAAQLEEEGLLKGPSSSPSSNLLLSPWKENSPEEDPTSFPLPKKGSYILIDNSNAWIGGRGEAQKRCGPHGDWRINHSKLREKILNGQEECRTVVFGSDPNATAWQKFRDFGMEVVVTNRSRSNNRECLVDNQLTQYLCEDSAALDEYSSLFRGLGSQARELVEEVHSSRVYCVVSGDKGYLESIKWVLERGFRVKVYAWERGCAREYANEMRREAGKGGKWEGRFELILLDQWFEDIKERVFEGKEIEQKENLAIETKVAPVEGAWSCAGESGRKKRVQAYRRKNVAQKKRGTRHCPYREGCTSYGKEGGCKFFHTDEEIRFFGRHGRKTPYRTVEPFCWICLKPHKMNPTCYKHQYNRPLLTEKEEEQLVASGYIRKRATVFFN